MPFIGLDKAGRDLADRIVEALPEPERQPAETIYSDRGIVFDTKALLEKVRQAAPMVGVGVFVGVIVWALVRG